MVHLKLKANVYLQQEHTEDDTSVHAKVGYVDIMVLSAALVCLVTLYTSERAVSGNHCSISLDHTSDSSGISIFHVL